MSNDMFIKLGLQSEQYQAGIEKAGKSAQDFEKSILSMNNVLKVSGAIIGAISFAKIIGETKDFIKESALLSARYTSLGVVMSTVGKNVGVSSGQMNAYAETLRDTGISAIESRQNIVRMAQANMDLAKSSDLARIAQDAAVIGQINSSEAFGRMIYGIQSAQVEILRTIGLNVSFEESYKKLARQLDKNMAELTQQEKTQARVNAVMEAGTRIQGTYEAAMTTASKKLGSMTRYTEDLKVEFGKAFEPALIILVDDMTRAIKDLSDNIQKPEFRDGITQIATGFANLAGAIIKATTATTNFIIEWAAAAKVRDQGPLSARFLEDMSAGKPVSGKITRQTKGAELYFPSAGGKVPKVDEQISKAAEDAAEKYAQEFIEAMAQITPLEQALMAGGLQDISIFADIDKELENFELIKNEKSALDLALMSSSENLSDMETERRTREMEELRNSTDYKMALKQEEVDNALALQLWLLDYEKQIEEEKKQLKRNALNDSLTATTNTLEAIYTITGKKSKELFELVKTAKTAEAIINTYSAADRALSDVPYPYNLVAAAAIIAVGLANVATIQSTNFGSTGGGGSVGTYPVSPNTGIPETGRTEQQSTLTINIEGDFIGDEAYIEMLAEKISEAVEDKNVRLVASNSMYAEALV